MAKVLIPLAALAALVFTGCSSTSDDAAAPQEVSAGFIAAAEAAVADAVLTLDDLPPGWSSEPQTADDDIDPEFTGPCEVFNDDEFPGQIAAADSDELKGPAGQQVFVTAIAFPTADIAEEALDVYGEFTAQGECKGQLEAALTSEFQRSFLEKGHSEATAASVTVSVGDLPFATIGTSTKTYRITWGATAQGQDISGKMDFVFWQENRLLGGMVYIASSPKLVDQGRIARLIARKMERADASLEDVSAYAR